MLRPLALAAVLALYAAVSACATVSGEPTVASPEPSAEPSPPGVRSTPATSPPSPTTTPPEVQVPESSGPGRQPPLPNPDDTDVTVALDAIAYLTGNPGAGAATARVEKQLTSYGWEVARAGDYLVATRGAIPPGRPWHLLTATFDEPVSVGTLLTVAAAFTSRSTRAPLALVVASLGTDAATYAGTLTATQRADLELDVDLAGTGASAAEIRTISTSLVGRL